MKTIKGMPVKSETTMNVMGSSVKSSTEVIEYNTNKKAPKNIFEILEGYRKKPD